MKSDRPPRLARRLLRLMADPLDHDALHGDLDEMFALRAADFGRRRARNWYRRQVLRTFPLVLRNALRWSLVMFGNYLKITFRIIRRQKLYSFINIFGLAVGLAACILIVHYVAYDLDFDRHHANADRIFRIRTDLDLGGQLLEIPKSSPIAARTLESEMPEVVRATWIDPRGKTLVRIGDRRFYEEGIFNAQQAFFEVFEFPLLKGDPGGALATDYAVVLTEETAERYFPGEEPIGKILKIEDKQDYTVTGVAADVPLHSHFHFNMLLSYRRRPVPESPGAGQWLDVNFYVYLLLRDKASGPRLDEKLPAFIEQHMGSLLKGAGGRMTMSLQPLTGIHLHSHLRQEIGSNSSIVFVYLFSVVAGFILLIACMNFMNLSTARSAQRFREVGIRKVLGADRRGMRRQFFGEALIFSFLSMILAVGLARLALPFFNAASGLKLTIDYLEKPWLIPALLGLMLLTGLAAGTYPAFFLSAFSPARIMGGHPGVGASRSRFRSVLVTVQFTIAIILIVGTGMVFKQLHFMKNRALGFDRERIVVLPVRDAGMRRALESFKRALKNHPAVTAAAASSHVPGQVTFKNAYLPEGFADDQLQFMGGYSIDPDYIPLMRMTITAGRNFSREFTTDSDAAVLINQAAARAFGWDDPIGRKISSISASGKRAMTGVVAGVVGDFHYASLRTPIEPVLLFSLKGRFNAVSVRFASPDITGVLAHLRKCWAEFSPRHPFEYFFLDDSLDRQYRSEERMTRIFTGLTVLAVFVACLGLFGLSVYMTERRSKEIGIRKVLGASTAAIVRLMAREFLLLVVLGNLIAWPVAYLALYRWLRGFAYRARCGWEIFLLAGGLAVLIALLTVSVQALRAAGSDPVKSLRRE